MSDAETRRSQVAEVFADPPPVHGQAAGARQVWATEVDCYEFIARHVEPGARTLETGCGVSTALFALWGTEHTCVVYAQEEADILLSLGPRAPGRHQPPAVRDRPLRRASCRGWSRPPLDLVLIDGSHAFPAPIIDWFYGAGRLVEGGIVILDDLQLAAVRVGLLEFLAKDPRWELVAHSEKWAAFRRHSSGPLREEWTEQRFLEG